ncbi:MAG: hypothetical protein ACTTIC_05155 [Helicobacteraceae bacterium]
MTLTRSSASKDLRQDLSLAPMKIQAPKILAKILSPTKTNGKI